MSCEILIMMDNTVATVMMDNTVAEGLAADTINAKPSKSMDVRFFYAAGSYKKGLIFCLAPFGFKQHGISPTSSQSHYQKKILSSSMPTWWSIKT
jgi:hypothetical protein